MQIFTLRGDLRQVSANPMPVQERRDGGDVELLRRHVRDRAGDVFAIPDERNLINLKDVHGVAEERLRAFQLGPVCRLRLRFYLRFGKMRSNGVTECDDSLHHRGS
ncbi:hypothetical protein [Massilia terrae]|uniref:Uncharacterized protein n=1 Tax=Massilia terrae TaxID=1811224 RepID=A0ABT2CXA0_9BURK|nr:hypothetical protein [Massilia terrae]MCS0658474.1 hypothetical protein [Massilia terrae]